MQPWCDPGRRRRGAKQAPHRQGARSDCATSSCICSHRSAGGGRPPTALPLSGVGPCPSPRKRRRC
eukprot:4416589-Lingulodinium_polyedra.AAC.1